MSKTTCIALLLLCLISSCTEKMICPAYQSSFILDDDYRERFFSPFEVVGGDTVPKGDFSAQRRRSNSFLSKIWSRPERPVLENPYLMARIFNKRPYWKLDIIEPELIHYVNKDTVDVSLQFPSDSTQVDSLQVKQTFTSVLTLPDRLPPHNQDQIEYNKKFGDLFPKPPKPVDPADTAETLDEFMNDTLALDSVQGKKGLFGIFKKKNKNKPKKEKRRSKKKNNQEGTKEEEDN